MNLINNTQTMSSLDLLKIINSARQKAGENKIRGNDFSARVADELAGDHYEIFVVQNSNKTETTAYKLTIEQCLLVGMRESKAVRRSVLAKLKALEEKEQAKAIAAQSRQAARLEAPFLTDAVKLAHDEPKHYHYSNEFNLINRIVLGMTSKKYRDEHELGKADAIRDHLTPCEIAAIEHLQRANTTMIEIGLGYEERKNKLSKLFVQRHQRKLLNELKRLEY